MRNMTRDATRRHATPCDATRRHATPRDARGAAQRDTPRDATRRATPPHATRDATPRATPQRDTQRDATRDAHATCDMQHTKLRLDASTCLCTRLRICASACLRVLHVSASARTRACVCVCVGAAARAGWRDAARLDATGTERGVRRAARRAARGAARRAPLRVCLSLSACGCSQVHVRAHKYPEHREKIIKIQNCAVIHGGVLLPRSGSA